MHWEATKRQKPNPPKIVELSFEEQAKQDWVKEFKILQYMCTKDIRIFTKFKIKGQKMVGDKQSGVTEELLLAVENARKAL